MILIFFGRLIGYHNIGNDMNLARIPRSDISAGFVKDHVTPSTKFRWRPDICPCSINHSIISLLRILLIFSIQPSRLPSTNVSTASTKLDISSSNQAFGRNRHSPSHSAGLLPTCQQIYYSSPNGILLILKFSVTFWPITISF